MKTLIPQVQKCISLSEEALNINNLCSISFPRGAQKGLREAIEKLSDEIYDLTTRRPQWEYADHLLNEGECALKLSLQQKVNGPEGYRMTITANGIELSAEQEAGLFYGIQTLRQLVKEEAPFVSSVQIDDYPALAARGLYHDITRGRVPKMETLKRLIDRMAYYKYNQLQLYIEHTFLFRNYSEIWGGSEGLSAEDIMELDAYARERHIELVPSLSSFGHCYHLLCSKRFEHLNELDVPASEKPFSFIDRMAHYTLDSTSDSSMKLICSMLDEFLALFSSKRCNICCDETFDLGKGRNKDKGSVEQLYVNFLQKLILKVNSLGKQAMFWGDIIGKYPEALAQMKGDYLLLDWDYSANLQDSRAPLLHEKNVPFYVCPGTQVWNEPLPRVNLAYDNIKNSAQTAIKNGAIGLLTTDWGDYGTVNHPLISFYGLALGGALSWTPNSFETQDSFDDAIDQQLFRSSGVCNVLRKIDDATKVGWCGMGIATDESDYFGGADKGLEYYLTGITQDMLKESLAKLEPLEFELQKALAKAVPVDTEMKEALLLGMRLKLLCCKTLTLFREPDAVKGPKVAAELRAFEHHYVNSWHKVSRPSEYYRVKEAIMRAAKRLDAQGPKFA